MPRIRRPLHLLFGASAYALALLSMVGFIGWQADLPIPFAIDRGPVAPREAALAVDLGLLLSFGVVHSLLARRGAKRLVGRLMPAGLVRSVYTSIAGVQMVALMAFWRPLPAPVWSLEAPVARDLVWALQGLGWALVAIGFWTTGNTHLFGLAQAWASARDVAYSGGRLVARGIYRWMRHPLYAGTLLALWAIPSASEGRLLLASVFSAYTLVGARFEEHDLAREHGESYLEYRHSVPAYLPWPRPAPSTRATLAAEATARGADPGGPTARE
ncbi:MAG: isoprenylcysteine carboxylmethyltransferase family protein [Holophagales bacterium]|nr:isoprenylcysteine carboxylmethyltransferase family protein [Holophagales bacterium]